MLVAALIVVVAGCGSNQAASGRSDIGLGPLSPRNRPVAIAVGADVLVVGGNQFFCGPTEDCARPQEAPLTDGAILDTTSNAWRSISPAPFGLEAGEVAHVGSDVFVLTQCEEHPSCPGERSVLQYSVDNDVWSRRARVPGTGYHHLVVVNDQLFAVSASDESPAADFRYQAASDEWMALDPAPMPRVFDRFGVGVGDTLVLYGSPLDGASQEKFVASYDLANSTWTELGRAPSLGWQVFDVEDTVVLNPHFSTGIGGLHDVAIDAWTSLPERPDEESWDNDIAGVIGETSAHYEYGAGWMLDLRKNDWVELPRTDSDAFDASIVSVGNSLLVVGGHHWTDGEVRVDGGATLWSPPG